MEGYIGEIRLFAGTFAPRNWAFCQGQSLQIYEFEALYSILGTQYGGDGRTYFKLPDLRGRVAVGAGQGPGLTPITQGQAGNQNQSGSDGLPHLGLDYIICLNGIYPCRN